jgi:hypothetical protein
MTDELVKLGDLIDSAFELREDRREVDAGSKKLKTELDELEAGIFVRLEDQGMVTGRAVKASATVTEQVVGTTDDFDATLEWIGKDFENRKYLLYRKVLGAPIVELYKAGEDLPPGTSVFTKRSLSLKKNPD